MRMLGPYTGDPAKLYNYQVGAHWKGLFGYRVVEGTDEYNHYFGGQTWEIPVCPNCKESMHQILTFDVTDPRLEELHVGNLTELPLISCLNCSLYWEPQIFQLDPTRKAITIMSQNDAQNWQEDDAHKIPTPLPRLHFRLENMVEDDLPTDDESYDRAFGSFGEEYICRVLGAPLYAQGPIDRECPCCHNEMVYVSSITGEYYGNERSAVSGVDFVLGEVHIYYLLCKKCLVVKTEMQST